MAVLRSSAAWGALQPGRYYEFMRNVLLCLALSVSQILAGPPTTKLTIEVTNQDGKPVDRASVIVRFIKGHSVLKLGKADKKQWEMKTNQEGRVTIPPIPQGTILVQVIARNYQTFGDNIDVDDAEKTVHVKLKPPQSQYSAHDKEK